MSPEFLRFESVGKSFPGVRALDGVSFGVGEGSVHALMGENGAGKSTLLKILSGAYEPSEGTLSLDGKPVVFRSTAEAIEAGVAVIYQELHLARELSVAENLYLGHLPSRFGVVNRTQLLESARKQLDLLGEDIDPRAKVGSLSIAQRQMVEIAKALSRDAKVIAFDEPTSSLTTRETERLFALIKELQSQGRVILYVSHRMEEIFQICDAATVLRDGRHVETYATLSNVTVDTLIGKMVGRAIQDIFHYEPRPHGEVALEVDGIVGLGLREPVSFSVAKGEIVGFFGLVGAGRSELLKLIYGAEIPVSGTIKIDGRTIAPRHPSDSIRAGIVLCPEDRKKEGIVPIRSVMENCNLNARRNHSTFGFVIDETWERKNAQEHVDALAVKTPSLAQLIVNLSGGNQQKVILARWLSEKVKVIMLDEPTRGIDVGAKSEIYAIIYGLAKEGVAVIIVSSELPEVMGICDRIIVMRQRRFVASVPREEATAEKILELALPVSLPQREIELAAI
ncbi:MAG: L-arabinose transport system ATP-binding protein [Chthoniobacter sp.]|jgi:L-arabinose transport system ATP-binding protein|nr:L-arabinose transport system ATP-binding protein [Chthoniobacter sp.]